MIVDAFLDDWAPIPDKRIDFLVALRDNPPPDIRRLYWLARVTLVTRLDELGPFDALFAAHFMGTPLPTESPDDESDTQSPAAGRERARAAAAERGHRPQRRGPRPAQPAHVSSPRTTICGELRKALREHLPQIRSRRLRPRRRGHLDLRRTLRAATRTGEITTLARRGRPHRTRPLLLLIDVSGSLREHTPDYLRFAWAAQGETFTFGTRLTRVTKELRERNVDVALAAVSERVEDADGGTRIGPTLHEFVHHAALRRPRARRADDRAVRRPRARRPGADGARRAPPEPSLPSPAVVVAARARPHLPAGHARAARHRARHRARGRA